MTDRCVKFPRHHCRCPQGSGTPCIRLKFVLAVFQALQGSSPSDIMQGKFLEHVDTTDADLGPSQSVPVALEIPHESSLGQLDYDHYYCNRSTYSHRLRDAMPTPNSFRGRCLRTRMRTSPGVDMSYRNCSGAPPGLTSPGRAITSNMLAAQHETPYAVTRALDHGMKLGETYCLVLRPGARFQPQALTA